MAAETARAFESLEKVLKDSFDSSVNLQIQRQLLAIRNDTILCWLESEKCIVSYNTNVESNQENNIQRLKLSTSPLFDVTHIQCNSSGNHILIYGRHGLATVEIPRYWKDKGGYDGGRETIHCRSTLLDDHYFNHHVSQHIVQASWYSGSPSNTHILVLTSDNCIRCYDLSIPYNPIVCLPLFDGMKSSRGGNTFNAVIGGVAVGFDIAQPITDMYGNENYPIYVMQESGDVWVLHCKFTQNRLHVEQQGPLTVNPPATDNYGCDYCSILCLPSTPTSIVMATRTGTIYHCVVIVGEDNESDVEDLNETRERFPVEALYVYESVQLELNFLHNSQVEHAASDQPLSNLTLIRDRLSTDSYMTACNGGVHMVTLPWFNEMETFFDPDKNTYGLNINDIQSPAYIQYLLCTQPSKDSPADPVCGCIISDVRDPVIILLLTSGKIIRQDKKRAPASLWNDTIAANRTKQYSSPLRQLHGVGRFDYFISRILEKKAVLPAFQCGSSDDVIPADIYYNILTKATRVLREEYIQKMIQAKAEVEKRCKILREKKEDQLLELQYLQQNKDLSSKSEELATKLEAAKENTRILSERVANILRRIQNSSPIISNEEKEWGQELKLMQERMTKLRRLSEVVNTKHENLILQMLPLSRAKQLPAKPATLSAGQVIKVRAVLKDQGTEISKLVEEVNQLSVRIGT